MRSLPVLFLAFSIPSLTLAAEECSRISKLSSADNAAKAVFICGKKPNTFRAVCDLTTDPVETGRGWLEVKKAAWAVHGQNKGIAGKFGFVTCQTN